MGDLRKPSGIFFVILGITLTAYSFTGVRAPLTDYNLNLITGLIMLGFGGTLLWLAQRAS
jgi:hypothetical protein